MTLPGMLLVALSMVYGGISLAYVRERLRRRHENAVLDLITFPCILVWSVPFAVYWLVQRFLLAVLQRRGVVEEHRNRIFQAWGVIHLLLMSGAWLFAVFGIRAPDSPILGWLMLLGVTLPLEIYVSVPETVWKLPE